MTATFCIIIFLSVAAYDVVLLIKKRKAEKAQTGSNQYRLVTEVIRHWYVGFPFVPYAVGIVWLGHFLNYIHIFDTGKVTLIVLISTGIPMLVMSFIMTAKKIEFRGKWKWVPAALIIAGYVIGDIVW